jgi:hydrogenase large subunit
VEPVDLDDPEEIKEYVARSYYEYSVGKEGGLHPYAGETNLHYTGPTPPFEQLQVEQSYSWLKSPRWKGNAMEVGPLARMLLLYATGNEEAKALVDSTLQKLELPVEALYSTLGRVAARTLETKLLADSMQGWYDGLIANIRKGETRTFNEKLWNPSSWPKEARGAGFMEAPRGALAHWIVIDNGKIANYQAVVPSTWNAGPRDAKGQPGAYEAALVGHTLHDPKQPLEILRTIHSFDPCIACAVHVLDSNGAEMIRVKVQ